MLAAPVGISQGAGRLITTEEAAEELGIDLSQPLSVDACIALALRVHPDVLVAANDLQQAVAGVRQARASLFPNISASTDYRVTEQPTRTTVVGGSVIPVGGGRSTSKNSQVSAYLEAYRTGRGDQIHQAQQYARAAREGTVDTRRRLAYLITQSYYDWLAAEKLVAVNIDAETSAQGHVDMVDARIAANDAAPVDIHRVRAQLHQSQLGVSSARNQVAISRASFWSALGEPETPIEIIDIWDEPRELPQLDECIEMAMATRPDLAQTEVYVRAARTGLKIARLNLGPTASVAGSSEYGRHDGNTGTSWTIYGTLSQSIFDGGANRAGVASAKAQLNSALANLERLKRSIRLEVETAWLRLRQSAEAIAAAEASQTESQAALDAAERRYQADVGILLEITDGRATATSADISVVNAHYDYNTALADLDRSIGTDLTPSNPPGE